MSAFFTKYPWLWIVLISMVPVVELRGAIPTGFFGYDLPIVQVCIISAIANLIPVPIIYFFARKVLVWGKDKKVIGKFFTFCLEKGEKGGKKLSGKTGIGLFYRVGSLCRHSPARHGRVDGHTRCVPA